MTSEDYILLLRPVFPLKPHLHSLPRCLQDLSLTIFPDHVSIYKKLKVAKNPLVLTLDYKWLTGACFPVTIHFPLLQIIFLPITHHLLASHVLT